MLAIEQANQPPKQPAKELKKFNNQQKGDLYDPENLNEDERKVYFLIICTL